MTSSLAFSKYRSVLIETTSIAPGIIYDQDKLETYHTARRYGQSKLSNILHARELQRRYPSITATAVHPGVIMTDLYIPQKKSNPLARLVLPLAGAVTVGVPYGAKNQLWAATGGSKEEVRSSPYWTPIGSKVRLLNDSDSAPH